MGKKFLIIRFSSFGDIVQCLSIISGIKEAIPQAEIHWVVRQDLSPVLHLHPGIDNIWKFERKSGLLGLIRMALSLRKCHFDYVYDAHSNLRSRIITVILFAFSRTRFIRRSKDRIKRFLLFKLRINLFPWPFRGMKSYQSPLKKIGIRVFPPFVSKYPLAVSLPDFEQLDLNSSVVLVPSAAWEMKRWPIDYWKELIKKFPSQQFVLLGGKDDFFCEDIRATGQDRIFNMAGKLSLIESCYVVQQARAVISADTGLLHVADLFFKPAIALIGPTAFGFTTGDSVKILETPLKCRPCTKDGRGKCSQQIYKKCMVDITPEKVASELKLLLGE